MRKYSLLIIVLLKSIIGLGQDTSPIKAELPTIIPPSPTVAALMKFEEVPVSNYTGVPDISIPLFKSGTLSKDINLDISLKYHPSGVAADERASDVGLGWSLFAGGSISRTVRGIPDDIFEIGGGPTHPTRIGLYRNESTNINYRNNFYEAFNYLYDYYDAEGDMDNIPENGFDKMDEYLWNTQVKGAFDAEHDLWQFNFMGFSGRFYIKKNQNNQLEVVPLDDYRLKIINEYGDAVNPYKPTSFIIFDDKGYKYTFDIIETTTIHSMFNHSPSLPREENDVSFTHSYTYESAFHLSKIQDKLGNFLIHFNFEPAPRLEKVLDGATTYYVQDPTGTLMPSITDFFLTNICSTSIINFNPYPTHSTNGTQKDTYTKKLKEIEIDGIAKIKFNFTQGRLDGNYLNASDCYVFDGIEIKTLDTLTLKKIELEHGYSETTKMRLTLKNVHFKNYEDTKKESYELLYRENLNPYSDSSFINRDYWGYFNLRAYTNSFGTYRETHPEFCTTETLQKMVLPTGGCVIFDFEPNTYSYIGSQPIVDYDNNPNNWDEDVAGIIFDNTDSSSNNNVNTSQSNKRLFFEILNKQTVSFTSDIVTLTGSDNYYIKIYKQVTDTTPVSYIQVAGTYLESGQPDYNHRTFESQLLFPGKYMITVHTESLPVGQSDFVSAQIYVFYKTRNSNNYQFLYGGGNRINRIAYFDQSNIPQDYYQISSPLQPSKVMNYEYNFFSNSLKSSGSLAYDVPKFDYHKTKKECTYCLAGPTTAFAKRDDYWSYHVSTTFNNLSPIKTQGSDVGYQNVRVFETGNGRKDFIYDSPIDVPEAIGALNLSPPFLPTENLDYKRGLLKHESTYDQQDRVLNETELQYDYENHVAITGIKTFYHEYDFINIYNHNNYSDYKSYIQSCGQHPLYLQGTCNFNFLTDHDGAACECFCYFGRPREFITAKFTREAFGWSKLKNKESINYFYDDNNNPKDVKTFETYNYHLLNKQIDEQTVTTSLSETLKTKYFYLETVDSPISKNNISTIEKVETYRGSDLVSTSKINYSTNFTGNTSYLPASIQVSKGSGLLENRVRYNAYDNYGHPLEVQQENGITICYIWGYHNTQVVAKIENIAYGNIPTNLINAIHAVTDDINLVEMDISAAITALRSDPSLANAMITTFTYEPLVGVSTITDPRGMKTTYEYDSFGRLEAVKDHQGNILSANDYHYRTQN